MEDPIIIINRYLDLNKITIDKSELNYQLKSHPEYPSLLSISDTLSFFSIDNGAFKVNFTEFENLPSSFMGVLQNSEQKFLSLIQKKDDYLIYSDTDLQSRKIKKEEMESLWNGVVLLAEKGNTEIRNRKFSKSNAVLGLVISLIGISLFISEVVQVSLALIPFVALSFVGLLFSFTALKDILRLNNSIIDSICPVSTTLDCKAVIQSAKWKIFEKINFSDLSITLFVTQLIAILPLFVGYSLEAYININKLLFLLSAPLLAASIYYQNYIIKKWCTVCLTIIAVITCEGLYSWIGFASIPLVIDPNYILFFGFTFLTILYFWNLLKGVLNNYSRIEGELIKMNRFKRDYSTFTNNLAQAKTYNLPDTYLRFGNPAASLHLTMVTSPLCGHCETPNNVLQTLLDKYKNDVYINFIFNVNPANDTLRKMAENLIQIHLKEGKDSYFEALESWYKNKNYDEWLQNFKMPVIEDDVHQILDHQFQWCLKHNFNFTPIFFINHAQYPKQYNIPDIEFFVEDLIEDLKRNSIKAVTEKLVIE